MKGGGLVVQGRAALLVSDLVVSQGADNTYAWRYGTRVGDVTTFPDLTVGWGARAQIRNRPGGDVWADLTTTLVDGSGITLGADGTVVLHLHHTLTEDAAWNSPARARGRYDVELVKPDGEKVRLVMGDVVVSADVTRDV